MYPQDVFGTQTESRLAGADNDTGAGSFTSRRFNQARAETWGEVREGGQHVPVLWNHADTIWRSETAPSSD